MRQVLIPESRFGRYLFYATGEIVLVVIGILIALQINNWNEERKQKIKDYEFLKSLKLEIQLDTANLLKQKAGYITINERIYFTLSKFEQSKQVTIEEDSIISVALSNISVLTPKFKNIARNDIILAGGALNRIDTELNQNYILYLENMQHANNIISKLGETLQLINTNDVSPFVDLDYRINDNKNVYFNINEISTNRRIKNALNKSLSMRNLAIRRINDQVEEAKALLSIINKHLTDE